MSRVVRIGRALRNHPKKSIVISAIAAYCINRGKGLYDEEQIITKYCREAAQYGEERFPISSNHRHITVILNPAANGGSCRARFDKYCAPLLHLAGLKVAIVRTEHQGQAKELMQVMEKTDGVVVAGGDGTLSEVLTGLLRRTDGAAGRLPLSVLPLGSNSLVGRALWGLQGTNAVEARDLLEATMAVVRQVVRPMHVMEVTPHQLPDADPEAEAPKPVYAASFLEWGAYRDARERRDKYWYWASLKRYITFVFSSYKDLTWSCDCDVEFTLPCSGCSNCCSPAPAPTAAPVLLSPKTPSTAPKKWYQYLMPDMRPSTLQKDKESESKASMLDAFKPDVDYSLISNPACGVSHTTTVEDACDLRVTGPNTPTAQYLAPHQLALHTGISNTSTRDFIDEGWRRTKTGEMCNDRELLVGSITIKPKVETKDKKGNNREFSVDGEEFEIRPVTIRALPRAVLVFAPPIPAAA